MSDPTSFGEFLVQAAEIFLGLIAVLGGFGIGAAVAIGAIAWVVHKIREWE